MCGEHGVEGGKGVEPRQGGAEEASEVVTSLTDVLTSEIRLREIYEEEDSTF